MPKVRQNNVNSRGDVFRGVMVVPESLTTTTTAINTASRAYVYPFAIYSDIVLRRIWIEKTTTSTGNFSFGIYNLAGNLIVDSGIVNTASTGIISHTLPTPLVLECGIYYLAFSSAVNITFRRFTATNYQPVINAVNPHHGRSVNVGTSGSLPATLGGITGGNDVTPFMALEN
jgi:hypothetical protein